jgi:hypothetical protein
MTNKVFRKKLIKDLQKTSVEIEIKKFKHKYTEDHEDFIIIKYHGLVQKYPINWFLDCADINNSQYKQTVRIILGYINSTILDWEEV